MPGAVLHFLRIYPYFFDIYLCIFHKPPSLDAFRLDARGRRTPPHPPLHATYLTAILCFFCSGMFSFYAQQNIHEASTIVEFIENAMRHSQEGKCLYYLRPRSPSAAPAPVQLLYPVSRFLGVFSLKHLAQAAVLSHLRRPDLIDRLPLSTVEKESLRRQQHTRRQRAGP